MNSPTLWRLPHLLPQQPTYSKKGIDLAALSSETLLTVQQFVRTTSVDYGPVHFLITDSPKSSNI